MTSASKVGDLFSAAGEAFTKLSELTHILQTSLAKNANSSSNEDNNDDRSCWLASDTESLQLAVKRFGDDLNVISEHIKDKTMYQIKTTFRKIHPSLSNASTPNEKSISETNSGLGTPFGVHDSSAGYQSIGGMATTTVSSMSEANNASQRANPSSAANSFPVASTASGGGSNAAAASSCSSPSPFLHYPLLRKSADITLNMLNARDDSDDDERLSASVFNSV